MYFNYNCKYMCYIIKLKNILDKSNNIKKCYEL